MKRLTLSLCSIMIGLVAWPEMLLAADQSVVVVLDDSGSMNSPMRGESSQKMDVAKTALLKVLSDIPDGAEVGVLALNSSANQSNWIVPLGPVDRESIKNQIARIRAEGSTPLGDAMKTAADALLAAREKNVYGTYRLLIVTDGEASDQILVDKYLPEINSRGLTTDVIGVDMNGQHSLARQVNTYRRANDPETLVQAIAQVFAETSSQDANTGESDYDMLGGLSDEVAAAAVNSLTQINNQPIGNALASASVAVTTPMTPSAPARTLPRTGPVPGQASRDGGSVLGLVCVGGFVLMAVIVAFLKLASQSSRNRTR